MSMHVDYNTPLTRQERSYLLERGLYADIERADMMHGTESPELPAGDGTGTRQVPLNTAEDRAARVEQLRRELADLTGSDDSEEDDASDLEPYDTWNVDDLKAEIDARNEGRTPDQKISKTGTKPDLVARLEKDDEALS